MNFNILFLFLVSMVNTDKPNENHADEFVITMDKLGYPQFGQISLNEYLGSSTHQLKSKYKLSLSLKDRINHKMHKIISKMAEKKFKNHLMSQKENGQGGDNRLMWFLLGCFFGPLAVLAAMVIKPTSKKEVRASVWGCGVFVVLVVLLFAFALWSY